MSPPAATRLLARRAAALAFADLSRPVVEHAKACLLDWIGSAVCGSTSPTAAITHRAVRRISGQGPATLVGRSPGASAFAAALYNGAVSGVDEIDDVHQDASLHPGIVVVPAALAMAEEHGASGRHLLTALVAGYDVVVRVARAAGVSHYAHWHTTGTCGTFGAAAAAGSILGLDPAAMTMALGLAGTQAAGLWESLNGEATMAKHLHGGKAASSGLLAALLARDGFRGSSSILEGDKGFLAAASTAGPGGAEGADRALRPAVSHHPQLLQALRLLPRRVRRHPGRRGASRARSRARRGHPPDHRHHAPAPPLARRRPDARHGLRRQVQPGLLHGPDGGPGAGLAARVHPRRRSATPPSVASCGGWCWRPIRPAPSRRGSRSSSEMDRRPSIVEPVCRPPDVAAVRHKFVETAAPRLTRSRVERLLTVVDRLDRPGSLAELGRLLAAPSTRRLLR